MWTEKDIFKLINIVIIATNEVLSIYKSHDFEVLEKDDKTPLTLADRMSHECITEGLKQLGYEFPVLSEEGKTIPYQERKNWSYFWLIDPLDGTKEFINKNGEFTINIALVECDVPVIGVVSVPVKKEVFFAFKGRGAYKIYNEGRLFNDNDEIFKFAKRLPLEYLRDFIAVVGSRSHRDEKTEQFIEGLKNLGDVNVLHVGSSYKICYVAEGGADIYPRFGRTMEWDIAAGHVILEESGGEILNALNLEKIKYNKQSLENPPFIAKSCRFIEKYEKKQRN